MLAYAGCMLHVCQGMDARSSTRADQSEETTKLLSREDNKFTKMPRLRAESPYRPCLPYAHLGQIHVSSLPWIDQEAENCN